MDPGEGLQDFAPGDVVFMPKHPFQLPPATGGLVAGLQEILPADIPGIDQRKKYLQGRLRNRHD
jgi:hypothetical protein